MDVTGWLWADDGLQGRRFAFYPWLVPRKALQGDALLHGFAVDGDRGKARAVDLLVAYCAVELHPT